MKNKIIKELDKNISSEEIEDIYKNLTQTSYRTYTNEQEIAVIKLALEKNFSDEAISKLHKKFWWTNLGWENMKPHSLAYFKNLVKQKSKKKNLEKELEDIKNLLIKNRQKRDKYIEKYKFSKDIQHWLKIFDEYVHYHDLRKEMQCKCVYSFYLLLLEVSQRVDIKIGDLEWLWHHEIKEIIKGKKVSMKIINDHRKWVAVISGPSKLTFYSGPEAKKLKEKEILENNIKTSEIKGMGATKGLVRGRAKVCSGISEALRKVKKGDILVTNMTTLDYVPVMKISKAIITAEGGVTCHAAIIAREFKIPCIVGTKIATQVLKDNDEIEVNANKGIIRIINR